MKKLVILGGIYIALSSNFVMADTRACIDQAAAEYGIKRQVIQAIAFVESRYKNDAININTDGSRDVCMMQINSKNFAHLREKFGVTERDLRNNACICIKMGTYLLRRMGDWAGTGLTGKTINAYNAGVREHNINTKGQEYFEKVKIAYHEILRRQKEQNSNQ